MKKDCVFIALLGETLREIRVGLGLSQYQLADLSGCSRRHINQIERGKHETKFSTMFKLSLGLGVSMEEIGAALDRKISEKNYTLPPVEDDEDKE